MSTGCPFQQATLSDYIFMNDLINRLKSALNAFVIEHETLVKQDVHEEAMTAVLLHYFEQTFSDLSLNIDTNYNKRILDNEMINKQSEFLIEKLPLAQWPKNWENGQIHIKKEILPDFIFHNRSNANENFLIIELKKTTNRNSADRKWDHIKLHEMTGRDLNYEYGVFIDLKTGAHYDKTNPIVLTVYSKGDIIYAE